MAAVVAPRHPPLRPQHSTSSSSASSSRSPYRRVHRVTYVPQGPGKSSSASAAVNASTSTSQSRTHHSHHSAQPPPPPPPPSVDTYYGHEETSKLCARFVSHTFHCPETFPTLPSSNSGTVVSRSGTTISPQPPQIPSTLAHFVAYALHRTRLHSSVVFTALALLHRLKSRFPAARGSSGHRLFLAAYMLASKVVCDDTYSNKSWAVVGQNMFALREINQMEREMLGYLEWSLNIPGEDLARFEKEVRKVYGSGRERDSWGRGIKMRLTWGVGGAKQQEEPTEEAVSEMVPIATDASCPDNSSPHQLPTPTETGSAVIPISSRPVLAPITTIASKAAYPSPPNSPTSMLPAHKSMSDSDQGSSASTSPVDGGSDQEESDGEDDSYSSHRRPRLVPDREGDGSPSPTSSEESAALPTPPNSALSAGSHHHHATQSYSGYPQKMGKSHSVPGPGFAYPRDTSGREHIGRSSAPPVAVSKREPVVSSVTASHFPAFTTNVEEDGDAVMELEDEKHTGITYYTTPVSVQRRASTAAISVTSRASTTTAARKDLSSMRERERDRGREIKEGGRRERERSLRTYTVPCAW